MQTDWYQDRPQAQAIHVAMGLIAPGSVVTVTVNRLCYRFTSLMSGFLLTRPVFRGNPTCICYAVVYRDCPMAYFPGG